MMHRRVQARLGRYLEGELPRRQRARVEAHLEACADCRRESVALRRVVDQLRNLPDPTPSPWLTTRVVARIRDGEGRTRWQDGMPFRLSPRALRRGFVTIGIVAVSLLISRDLAPPERVAEPGGGPVAAVPTVVLRGPFGAPADAWPASPTETVELLSLLRSMQQVPAPVLPRSGIALSPGVNRGPGLAAPVGPALQAVPANAVGPSRR